MQQFRAVEQTHQVCHNELIVCSTDALRSSSNLFKAPSKEPVRYCFYLTACACSTAVYTAILRLEKNGNTTRGRDSDLAIALSSIFKCKFHSKFLQVLNGWLLINLMQTNQSRGMDVTGEKEHATYK
jgi:hypothetical protein